jgi:hypothetical protein
MSFVPIVPPTTVPPPSPRTRELAGILAKVLDEYTKAHPATTRAEIRGAIRMAQMSAGMDRTKVAAGVAVALGLGVTMLALGLLYFRNAGGVEMGTISPMIIMAVIVLLGIVAVIVKTR